MFSELATLFLVVATFNCGCRVQRDYGHKSRDLLGYRTFSAYVVECNTFPPVDLINKHLSDALNIDNSNTSTGNSRRRRSVEAHHRQRRATFLGIEVGDDETVNDILKYETSFVVAFVIGLLWAVLTLIIGSVFGCCRLCNNCGGSLAYDGEDKHANLKRWLLILSLFIALIFVL